MSRGSNSPIRYISPDLLDHPEVLAFFAAHPAAFSPELAAALTARAGAQHSAAGPSASQPSTSSVPTTATRPSSPPP